MSVNYDDARVIAQRLLETLFMREPAVIVDEWTLESGRRWAFIFQSVRFLETGDFTAQLAGNAPILVEKVDGSVRFGRTDQTVESQL